MKGRTASPRGAGAGGKVPRRRLLPPVPIRPVFEEATPVALGYIPLGFLFGAMAQFAGLSALQAAALSVFVYSGAAQLLAVQMLAAGASHLAIVLAASVLTVRHVLMGAALSVYTHRLPLAGRALLSPLLTDESFALAWRRYRKEPQAHGFFLGTNVYLYLSWNGATLAGYWAGEALPAGAGVELLFPLLFVAILGSLVTNLKEAAVAGLTLAALLALRGRIPVEWLVPLGGALAALLGVTLGRAEKDETEALKV